MPPGVTSGSQFTRRGSTQLDRDELFRLIAECNAVLRLEPQCLHTRAVRGHALMKAKQWDGAVRDFGVIIEARPDDIHGLFSRGMALFKSGRVDQAHADFSRVLEINPHHVMARYARAGCYNTEGKFHHAIEEYTIALEHDEMEMMGMRGKLPRGWGQRDIERVSSERQADSGPKNEQSVPEVPSPPKRIDVETRREVTPIPPQGQIANGKPSTGKKPRKVVQVKLSLSDLAVPAAQSTTSGQEMPSTQVKTAVPSTEPGVSVPTSQAPPKPPHPTPLPPTSSLVSTSSTQCIPRSPRTQVSTSRTHEPCVPITSPSTVPVSTSPPTQPVRRAVRRVTVAL